MITVTIKEKGLKDMVKIVGKIKNGDNVIYRTDEENHDKKVKRLLYHQRQLHYFLELYYNKEKFTESERDYYKKYTDSTYRKHLAVVAKLQEELTQFPTEAIL
jgi:regulator of sirC expression with transglutaminase-like and TPR domain